MNLIVLFCSTFVLFFRTAYAERLYTATEMKVSQCNTVCLTDGDKRGVLVNGQCGCWNPRDISKYIFKIERSFKGEILVEKQKVWEE